MHKEDFLKRKQAQFQKTVLQVILAKKTGIKQLHGNRSLLPKRFLRVNHTKNVRNNKVLLQNYIHTKNNNNNNNNPNHLSFDGGVTPRIRAPSEGDIRTDFTQKPKIPPNV